MIHAQRWYRYHVGAEQGDALAEANLALVEQDLVLAFMWFTISAAQGNETAQTNKALIEQWLTPEQFAEAQRLSREWMKTHPQPGGEPSETFRPPRR